MLETGDSDVVTTFGATSSREVVVCRVCGRSLLMGERSVGFFTVAGEGPYDVCQLCVPRASRYGLRPRQSTADEVSRSGRRHLGVRIAASLLSPLWSGRSTHARGAAAPVQGSAAVAAAAAAAGPGRRRGRRRRAAATPRDPLNLGAVPVGSAAIPIALAAFNQSPHARTLAGLYRTLGPPRASVAPRSATDREVILTVAWEIVWYQFRVMPDGIEQHRGTYMSELQERWQQWNCTVAADGTVREDIAEPCAPEGEGSSAAGQDQRQTPLVEAPVR